MALYSSDMLLGAYRGIHTTHAIVSRDNQCVLDHHSGPFILFKTLYNKYLSCYVGHALLYYILIPAASMLCSMLAENFQ